jgi:putative RNA 2'-phosphotransferase
LKKNYVKVSKFLSYILRHNPYKYGLTLDEKGFTDLNQVLQALNSKFKKMHIDVDFLKDLIKHSKKKRFQITNNRIRAYYGHSISRKIETNEVNDLPGFLYHGTTESAYRKIKQEGLISKSRQYVHLTDSKDTAIIVGKRRTDKPIILSINTKKARNAGVKFYKSGDMYLSDSIPPKFIRLLS